MGGALSPLAAAENADLAHGYFLGDVTTSKGTFGLAALFTVDGAFRMHATAETSWQFAGHLHGADARLVGSGNVIAKGCLPVKTHPCQLAGGALIRLTSADPFGLAGAIHVADDTWYFHLSWPNSGAVLSYQKPAELESIDGYYEVLFVDFTPAERVIMSVDRAGRAFFQSAVHGCTGNGSLAPYRDARYNTFTVSLVIANCGGDHEWLNGSFSGLATTNVPTPWDYGDALLMWLAKFDHDGVIEPAVIELRGFAR
jgi:hypothetical protein